MRKVILLMGMGLDGIGAEGWLPFVHDEALEKEHTEDIWKLLESVDAFLLGGRCYLLWKKYWPPMAKDPSGSQFQKEFSRFTDRIQKVVVSKRLKSVSWQNSSLVTGDVPKEIARMKRQPGKDMAIVGGVGIARTFSELGLIDEYQLWVHPVILGKGKSLLGEPSHPRELKLIETKTFKSGVVRLHLKAAT